LSQIRGAGKPFTVSKFYTASLGEKANLRADLKNWRGRDFTDEELAGFEAKNILGKPCMLSVVETESEGKTYSNIANNTKDEVDIGKFVVKSFGGEFEHASALSKHLSIMPRKSVKLSQSTLKFATSTQWVSLNFPNGQELAVSHKNQFDVASTSSISVKVFSKQDFEKQNIPKVVAKAQTKVLTTKKKMLTSENPKKDVTIDTSHTNTFVIENKQDSFVNNLLNYFGI
jgi:hypothetical protein